MTLLASLPLTYAPAARRVAVIGHGSGLTTHVLLASPLIERVDVIEIEPEMVRGARSFLPRVARAYEDPRSRMFIEDARAFFARTSERYDIIVSEPSNPWVSGVASLFTPEFYRHARRALNPGGLFVQWFHIYESDRSLVASIVRGIGAVFSDYVLYVSNDSDVILVASASGAVAVTVQHGVRLARDASRAHYLGVRIPADLTHVPYREPPRLRAAARDGTHELRLLSATRVRRRTCAFSGYEVSGARAERARSGSDAGDPVGLRAAGADVAVADAGGSQSTVHRRQSGGRSSHNVLTTGSAPSQLEVKALQKGDEENLRIVRAVPEGGTASAWQTWFSALFALSRTLIPNGGAPALDRYLRSDPVAGALRGAPQDVREKIEFLLAGRASATSTASDRQERACSQARCSKSDPIFHAYVFVATTTACLASTPDAACRDIIAQLDRVPPGSPVIDVLRAHKAALH